MSVHCSTTADSVTSVLVAGDVVVNLSGQLLNTAVETPFVGVRNGTLCVGPQQDSFVWHPEFASQIPVLMGAHVLRIVVVSCEDQPEANQLTAQLSKLAVPHLHCALSQGCDADSFMDEEDAEAVAERLRQLGYL